MNKKFGTHAGGVTPKDQSGHGKAHPTQAIVPPAKKGPPQTKGMPPAQTPK